jgi:TRAP transporter TAXI family solute receptor
MGRKWTLIAPFSCSLEFKLCSNHPPRGYRDRRHISYRASVLSRRALLRGAVLAAVPWPAAGCHHEPSYPAGSLRIATGGQGGVYFVYGQGIAQAASLDLPAVTATVLVTGASVDNLRMIADGTAELAFCLADSAAAAVAGATPFTAALPIAALARLYENYLHVVVPMAGPAQRLADLGRGRVSVGAAGSGTELIANRLLAVAGLGVDAVHLGVDESARELSAGRLDAFFFSGGLPTAAIDALAKTRSIRLLGVAELVPMLRNVYGEFYSERTIPASAYDLAEPVSTVGVANYLAVRASFDEELAYRLTRMLFERRELLASAHPEARRLDRASAISTYPVPLHPGAVRYYREVKQ